MVEVDVDTTACEQGHIPGTVGWNWISQLNDSVQRDSCSTCHCPLQIYRKSFNFTTKTSHISRKLRNQFREVSTMALRLQTS